MPVAYVHPEASLVSEPDKADISPRATGSELIFDLGVFNVILSAWLIGSFPWVFWIYYLSTIVILLCIRYYRFSRKRQQCWLLDYCYFINYSMILFLLLSIAGIRQWRKIAFRVLFTSCVGPLAMSIPLFRNSLIFHSPDHFTILAVHLFPNLSLWGMRWYPYHLNTAFPGVFDTGCEVESNQQHYNAFFSIDGCGASFTELYVWPMVYYIIGWATPYYIFFFILAKDSLKRGQFVSMFEDMKENNSVVRAVISLGGDWGQEFKYMWTHGILCYLALLLGPLFWHSFPLHSAYLIVIILVSVHNGSSFYFRVFAKKYYTEMYGKHFEPEKTIEGSIPSEDIERQAKNANYSEEVELAIKSEPS